MTPRSRRLETPSTDIRKTARDEVLREGGDKGSTWDMIR